LLGHADEAGTLRAEAEREEVLVPPRVVFVRLARHARQQVKAFRQHALSLPEAIAVYHVAGQHDFLVHVGVKDANHLRDLAMDAFTSRREVARIETHLIFEHAPRPTLPVLVEASDRARHRGSSRP
jgi:DNA-binding Lrp family transcriptional regulator